MAIKQFRNWFFQVTGIPGTRFLKNNKPTESVMRDFLESIGFIKEVSDTASTSQQGFVKKPTNAHIVSRSSADADGFALGVTPAQLPKVSINGVPIPPSQDSSGAQTYNVLAQTSTPPGLKVNNVIQTPVSGYYNVNTILESINLFKSPMNTLPVDHETSFTIAKSTLVSDGLTRSNQYNTLPTSAFAYNSTTGIITFLKNGYYNIEAWLHFGENTSANWWTYTNDPELGPLWIPGYFRSGIVIPSSGNFYHMDNAVFYAGNYANPAGEPYNSQLYVDMHLSRRGIHFNNGDEIYIRIQNNTMNANSGSGAKSGGQVTISLQLIALD